MNMTKKAKSIFLVTFCLMFFGIWIVTEVAEKYIDPANYELRSESEFPSVTEMPYKEFAAKLQEFCDNSIPIRNRFINVNSLLNYYIFHSSANSRVIIGKDGWLFYNDTEDGDPIKSYRGEDLVDEETMAARAQKLVDMRDKLASEGREFVVMFAPNKERVYSEYLPSFYGAPAERYAMQEFVDYLHENTDLAVVYPYDTIMSEKDKIGRTHQLFYKGDTHWNGLGGYIAARELFAAVSVDLPSIDSDEVTITEVANQCSDTAGIIKMSDWLQDNEIDYDVTDFIDDKDERSIYMIRDSFGIALIPYMDRTFSEFREITRQDYTISDLYEYDPDIVVLQFVERGMYHFDLFEIDQTRWKSLGEEVLE